MGDKSYYMAVNASVAQVMAAIPDRLKGRVVVNRATAADLAEAPSFLPIVLIHRSNIFDKTVIFAHDDNGAMVFRFKPAEPEAVESDSAVDEGDGGYW